MYRDFVFAVLASALGQVLADEVEFIYRKLFNRKRR